MRKSVRVRAKEPATIGSQASQSNNGRAGARTRRVSEFARQFAHFTSFYSSSSPPFRVAFDDLRGRHLVATKDIQPLELILRDSPLLVCPLTKTRPVCLQCLKITGKGSSYRCSGCRHVVRAPRCFCLLARNKHRIFQVFRLRRGV